LALCLIVYELTVYEYNFIHYNIFTIYGAIRPNQLTQKKCISNRKTHEIKLKNRFKTSSIKK